MDSKTHNKIRDFVWSIVKADIDVQRCLKFTDLYGTWGATYSAYASPLAFLMPSLATAIMLIGFKYGKLFGTTHKFIICIMIVNLCFISVSSLRDGLLAAFDMNYGCIEYKVCSLILWSFQIQKLLNGTSVWLKTLMILHQVILVAFPFKLRQMNFKRIWLGCAVLHLIMVVINQADYGIQRYEMFPLLQEYRPGHPLRRIMGCSPVGFQHAYSIPLEYVFLSYFQILPLLIQIAELLILQYFYRKNIRKLAILTRNVRPHTKKKIKFIILMKVNLFLGVSFVLQELPSVALVLWGRYDPTIFNASFNTSQGFFVLSLSISFMIGKPVDLLIYVSLSTVFRAQIKKIFQRCKAK